MFIKNNDAKQYHFGGKDAFTLNPGNNEVDDALWKKTASHEVTKKLIEGGSLEVVTGTEKKQLSSQSKKEGLAAMDEDKAIAIVNETLDKGQLTNMGRQDDRAGVQAAIASQLEKIQITEEEKARSKKR